MNRLSAQPSLEISERQWHVINDMAAVLGRKPAGRANLGEVLGLLAHLVPFLSGTIYLYNQRTLRLEEVVSLGEKVDLLDFLKFDSGSGLAAWVGKTGRPIYLPGKDPEHDRVTEHHVSLAVVPLVVGEDLLGVLCLSRLWDDDFEPVSRQILEVLATVLALSLERLVNRREIDQPKEGEQRARRQLAEAKRSLSEGQAVQEIGRELLALAGTIRTHVGLAEMESAGLSGEGRKYLQAIAAAARRIDLVVHKTERLQNILVSSNPTIQKERGPSQRPAKV